VTYRVVQFGTGNVGKMCARSVLRHPEMELVGVYVTNPDKAGRDAGELVGVDPLGLPAIDDLEELCALDADVVLHAPLPSMQVNDDPSYDEHVIGRLLRSGKNVITTVGYLYPKAYGPDVVERLEAACAAGGVSVHGTGANPGFMSELLPLTLSGMSDRIDRIYVVEASSFHRYPSPEVILGMLGMGKSPEEFAPFTARYRGWLTALFSESVWMLADGLALAIDGVEASLEVRTTDSAHDIAAGHIPAGSVAAHRWLWEGKVGDRAVIVLEAVYRTRPQEAPEWTSQHAFVIEGEPTFRFEVGAGWCSDGLLATAAHAVNAIPAVVGAAPGIRTFLDLPLIVGRHTARAR